MDGQKYQMSAWRRNLNASYKPPHEGVIHGAMTLDCSMWSRTSTICAKRLDKGDDHCLLWCNCRPCVTG